MATKQPGSGRDELAAMVSCTGTALAMQAATRGIELKSLEVTVGSESDARGLVGIGGVPTSSLRMTIKLSVDNVPESFAS